MTIVIGESSASIIARRCTVCMLDRATQLNHLHLSLSETAADIVHHDTEKMARGERSSPDSSRKAEASDEKSERVANDCCEPSKIPPPRPPKETRSVGPLRGAMQEPSLEASNA